MIADIKPFQENLALFSSEAQSIIVSYIDLKNFDGVIPAKLVKKLLESSQAMSIGELMLSFLPLASAYAKPDISNFYVGAVAQGSSGALYLGANLELAGAGLNNSVHAEQSAINNALLHQEQGITRIAVNHSPCGHCRQFLNEIKDGSEIEVLVLGKEPRQLNELLPESFKPADLGADWPLFTLDETQLVANEKISVCIEQSIANGAGSVSKHSYAPHTGALSSVLVKVSEAVFAVGVYIENAAYNPSLSPFMSALDRLRYSQSDFGQIKEVLLVELSDAVLSHEAQIASLISQLAPDASFETIKLD